MTRQHDILDLIRRGRVDLHNVPPDRDAFECLRDGDALYLLGSTPRGVLHAVYALEERLAFGPELPPDWHTRGVCRIGQRHFHRYVNSSITANSGPDWARSSDNSAR